MKILVVEEVEQDRTMLSELLKELNHEVRLFDNVQRALQHVEDMGTDIVITDWLMPHLDGLNLCKQIRKLSLSRYVYVILAVEDADAHSIKQVFDSDVDDFISKPYRLSEIMSRVRAGERIIHLEEDLRERILELKNAQRRLELQGMMSKGGKGAEKMAKTQTVSGDIKTLKMTETWQHLEQTCAQTYAQALMVEKLKRGVVPAGALPGGVQISTIMMSDVEHKIQIGLGVVVTLDSIAKMAEKMFGDASMTDPESVRDLLRELMNMLQGGLKVGFEQDGFIFTASLPQTLSTREFKQFCRAFGGVRTVAFEGEGITLFTIIGCHTQQNSMVKVKDLTEGLILAKPVSTPDGSLTLEPNTRLNATYLEKLQSLGPDAELEVGDPTSIG